MEQQKISHFYYYTPLEEVWRSSLSPKGRVDYSQHLLALTHSPSVVVFELRPPPEHFMSVIKSRFHYPPQHVWSWTLLPLQQEESNNCKVACLKKELQFLDSLIEIDT